MKTTQNWIRELCPADLDARQLENIFSRVGFEVARVERHEDDTVYDLEVTANHADWLGAIGIAREVAAVTGVPASLPEFELVEEGPAVSELTSVVVDAPDLCPLYIARVVTGAKVVESPEWLKRKLELIGLRPVNAIVDITNYLMFETGQPLHVFDMAKLEDRRIVVRRANKGEKIVAINSKEVALPEWSLVIADAKRPVAIAGVMGGAGSEISDDTTDILIECAAFHGPTTRRTTRAVGFTSDSSARFERGTDLQNAEYVSQRTAALIRSICGGEIAQGAVTVCVAEPPAKQVSVRPSRVELLLGFAVGPERICAILQNLGFGVTHDGDDRITATVPPWRKDVSREADLIEEVLRIEGFERVPVDLRLKVFADTLPDSWRRRRRMRDILTGSGWDEAVVDPFVEPHLAKAVRCWEFSEPVTIVNAMRSEQNALRTSLLPGLVKIVKNNHDRSVTGLRFFEIEKVYLQPADAKAHPKELEVLGLITDEGYAVAKGAVENALSAFLAVGSLSFEPADAAHMVPGRAVAVLVDGSRVGWCGEVSPRLLDALDLKSPVWAAELDFEALGGYSDKPLRSFDNSRIPRYPSVERDFAFVLPEEVRWADIEKAVLAACSDAPVEGVKFFDIYRGKQIAEGMKSVALRVVFRSPSGTLTDEQLTAPVSRIVEEMGSKFGATLRSR